MSRTAAVLLAIALAGSLAACSDDAEDRPPAPQAGTQPPATTQPTAEPTAAPPATSPATSAPPASPTATDEAAAPVPFPADTQVDVQEPTGGPLSVTAVRVARQDGYDRVVFELDGRSAGEPGWRVEYVTDPTQQGSGDPVEVTGEAVLSVTITGTGYPMDTGEQEVSQDPALPRDLQVVRDVQLGAVFEGQYEAFVGTSERVPFRVFRLGEPARVVLDVRHR